MRIPYRPIVAGIVSLPLYLGGCSSTQESRTDGLNIVLPFDLDDEWIILDAIDFNKMGRDSSYQDSQKRNIDYETFEEIPEATPEQRRIAEELSKVLPPAVLDKPPSAPEPVKIKD